jgi:acetoacetate decarboxylase
MSNHRGIMPVYSPLYPPPPYHYRRYERLSAFCVGHPDALRDFIPPPLEYVSERFTAFIMVVTDIDGLRPYEEGGIQIPVVYKGQRGIITAYEYTTTDDALCAGREVWGYPKKLIQRGSIDRSEGHIHGVVERLGRRIIEIDLHTGGDFIPPAWDVVSERRFQVKSVPAADGGIDIHKVISVNLEDSHVSERIEGPGTASFEPSEEDPLYRMGPVEVLGANYLVGSFVLALGHDV